VFSVSQGRAEALLGEVGKCSNFSFLTLSVIFLPNIMQFRQCCCEL